MKTLFAILLLLLSGCACYCRLGNQAGEVYLKAESATKAKITLTATEISGETK